MQNGSRMIRSVDPNDVGKSVLTAYGGPVGAVHFVFDRNHIVVAVDPDAVWLRLL